MCVRTKTTFGCGHVFRTIAECRDGDCPASDKYTFEKDGDCKTCKRDGAASTRGRDGLGRYAQEMKRLQARSRPTSIERPSSELSFELVTPPQSPLMTSTRSLEVVSPWAQPLVSEKVWGTPHRLQADEAWLSEHEDRLSDLQKRLGEISLSPPPPEPTTPVRRHHTYHVEDEGDDEEIYSLERDSDPFENAESPKRYITEFRRRNDDFSSGRHSSSGRSHQPEVRQYSYDSLPDSMPSYRSSPHHRTSHSMQYTTITTTPSRPNHEYDYYSGSSTPRTSSKRYSGRAKTEPYAYSRASPRGNEYDYEHAHPMVVDTSYPHQVSKHYRNNDYRYKALAPSPMPYTRYQSRY